MDTTSDSNRKTLFLDLDDTLIKSMTFSTLHSDATHKVPKPDFAICYSKSSGHLEHLLVYKRKGLDRFLEFASK